MEEKFYIILTKIGREKIANATALGELVGLTKFQVGDSNGEYYEPTEEQTALKNVVWEGNINSLRIDEKNPNWIVIETILPGTVGGFMIREAAVLDNENNIIAIGKYPETYKPRAEDGSIKDLVVKMILQLSNTSNVTLEVDPTLVFVTQKDIQDLETKIGTVNTKIDTTKTELTSNIETAKTELNTKIDQLIAGGSNVAYTQRVAIDDWVEDAESGFKATVTHSLLTHRIVVNIIDATTKENIVPNFKIVDDNSIEIRSEVKVELNVYVINGNAETHFINATVDDNRVSEMTTYSSKKIEDRLVNIEEKVNGGLSNIATSVNELITYC
nr:fused tail fiber protein [synthetic construct]